MASEVGDNQVRNMGTIGGVVAHADAAGDYPTIALMLDADIVTNRRTIPANDFFKDLFTTPLHANEIVTEVVFPVANGPHKYIKFRRRLFDWAIVGAAAQKMNGDWRIGLTNVGPTPVRATAVEEALRQGREARRGGPARVRRPGPRRRPAREPGVQEAPGPRPDAEGDRAGSVTWSRCGSCC